MDRSWFITDGLLFDNDKIKLDAGYSVYQMLSGNLTVNSSGNVEVYNNLIVIGDVSVNGKIYGEIQDLSFENLEVVGSANILGNGGLSVNSVITCNEVYTHSINGLSPLGVNAEATFNGNVLIPNGNILNVESIRNDERVSINNLFIEDGGLIKFYNPYGDESFSTEISPTNLKIANGESSLTVSKTSIVSNQLEAGGWNISKDGFAVNDSAVRGFELNHSGIDWGGEAQDVEFQADFSITINTNRVNITGSVNIDGDTTVNGTLDIPTISHNGGTEIVTNLYLDNNAAIDTTQGRVVIGRMFAPTYNNGMIVNHDADLTTIKGYASTDIYGGNELCYIKIGEGAEVNIASEEGALVRLWDRVQIVSPTAMELNGDVTISANKTLNANSVHQVGIVPGRSVITLSSNASANAEVAGHEAYIAFDGSSESPNVNYWQANTTEWTDLDTPVGDYPWVSYTPESLSTLKKMDILYYYRLKTVAPTTTSSAVNNFEVHGSNDNFDTYTIIADQSTATTYDLGDISAGTTRTKSVLFSDTVNTFQKYRVYFNQAGSYRAGAAPWVYTDPRVAEIVFYSQAYNTVNIVPDGVSVDNTSGGEYIISAADRLKISTNGGVFEIVNTVFDIENISHNGGIKVNTQMEVDGILDVTNGGISANYIYGGSITIGTNEESNAYFTGSANIAGDATVNGNIGVDGIISANEYSTITLRSPNNTLWRITVNDLGELGTVQL